MNLSLQIPHLCQKESMGCEKNISMPKSMREKNNKEKRCHAKEA
jgi:hypothetical protein